MRHFEKIKEAIIKTLACDEAAVTEGASLIDDLGADSLAMVELIMALEDAFGITVPEEAVGEIKTVGDIVDFVGKQA